MALQNKIAMTTTHILCEENFRATGCLDFAFRAYRSMEVDAFLNAMDNSGVK